MAGAAFLPCIGWGIHVTLTVNRIREDSQIMVQILRQPDAHGFGTGRTNKIIEDNTRAMQALTYYIQWLAKKDGSNPPPPLPPELGSSSK
jgi:hypothetical protein